MGILFYLYYDYKINEYLLKTLDRRDNGIKAAEFLRRVIEDPFTKLLTGRLLPTDYVRSPRSD